MGCEPGSRGTGTCDCDFTFGKRRNQQRPAQGRKGGCPRPRPPPEAEPHSWARCLITGPSHRAHSPQRIPEHPEQQKR